MSVGGFLAVGYLKNRDSTGDVDYLIDPEFAEDKEIKNAFHEAILSVAEELHFLNDWINEAMAILVMKKTQETLFKLSEKQDIMLFKEDNLEILAPPIEWALERKLRRIYAAQRDRKADLDLSDVVAVLKQLRTRNDGPLDLGTIRTMDMNGFDVILDHRTTNQVADAYRHKYNEDFFR
ncbi:hypothetical protein N7491_000909 [Penicillium cf. griseofulvum]|uniref:Uncharacterized protein n=1 Tax=Penicillium cf. griseofulvum TaxID=2972120 RepID=A0A9W9LYI3_9EURO|nr:hypothetical protein N7472_011317 [Penicillium cf. griseofulvum]KAJ5443071.1 hypothetical protein N7445_004822 [Penicillium cf. griseofulvum]KAJ5451727.1 hypothetical protein N7491_000909 [Penicillium cf. griseofulvum]